MKGDAIARLSHLSRAAAQPLPTLRGGPSHEGESAPETKAETEAKSIARLLAQLCWGQPSSHPDSCPPSLHSPLPALCPLSTSATSLSQLEPPPAPSAPLAAPEGTHLEGTCGAARGTHSPHGYLQRCPSSGTVTPTQYAGGQGRLLPLQADACQAGALPGPGRGNAMSLTALFRVFI